MSECVIVDNFDESKSIKKKKKRKHRKRIINEENCDERKNKACDNDPIMMTEDVRGTEMVSTDGKGDNTEYINSSKNETGSHLKTLDNNTDISVLNVTEKVTSSSSCSRLKSQDPIEYSLLPGTSSSVPNLFKDSESHSLDSTMSMGLVTGIERLSRQFSSHSSTYQLRTKRDEYQLRADQNDELLRRFPDKVARIMVITWNMCGISKYPEELGDLIENNMDEMCDIYLFSFQETTSNKYDLLGRLQRTLKGHYVIYDHVENGSLLSVLIGHKNFIWNLAVIGKGYLSTRITNVTKGVTAISFWFFGTSILFLGSHFSSERTDLGDKSRNHLRIEDYKAILYSKDLIKSLTVPDMKPGSDDKNLSHYFDHTFWTGDLNFRINRDDITVAKLILSEIEQNDGKVFEELLEKDELIVSQATGLVFQEFEEGRIMFLPTYKFIIQSCEYNEKRTPSYTDRVLFRSNKSRGIECIHYNSVPSYTCSDHKPVCAVMEVLLEPQQVEHLKSAGIFNKEIYSQCFEVAEQKQRESKPSSVCSIQ